MGLTKQYLRYQACGKFNVIGSTWARIVSLNVAGTSETVCAVGACEDVQLWNFRTSTKMAVFPGARHCVTALARSPDSRLVAAGYHNGAVCVFEVATGECIVTFSGHRSQVSALNFDSTDMQLVSGGLDTDVIVWDIVEERGKYRLKGHKGQITQAQFLSKKNVLITSSKDATVKFWDLDTQHCFKTLVDHSREVWDFVVVKNESLIVTSSADQELRVWRLVDVEAKSDVVENSVTNGSDDDNGKDVINCVWVGSIARLPTRDTVSFLVASSDDRFIACHGNNSSTVELFKVPSDAEIQKRLQKKTRKAKKKATKDGSNPDVVSVTQSVNDELLRIASFRLSHKLHSLQCIVKDDEAKVVALLKNNSIECCTLDVTVSHPECKASCQVVMPGHRTEPRTLSFSSDNTAVLSASSDSVRIWNRASQECIRAMDCEYALCSVFAHGDRIAVIGTKTGKLQIFDLVSAKLLESIEAHDEAVTSMSLSSERKGLVTGSTDKDIKFWDFEYVKDENYSSTTRLRPSLVHTRTLKMAEGVVCVRFSADHKLLAISLLDNTVKIFFADTCKFFLNLYGHSLPVTCLDMSLDSTIIATGSSDKSIRIWGLDFGNCQKFIRAHDAPVQCLQFIAKTHMFFTASQDGTIKEWDADTFEQITVLEGHHDFVNCLAISPNGKFLVSGSHDRSVRLWEKTDEILVLSEEKELEREKEHDEAAVQGAEVVVAGELNTEVAIAGKQTVATVQAAERLMEALDEYQKAAEQSKLSGKMPPEEKQKHVWEVVKRIKSRLQFGVGISLYTGLDVIAVNTHSVFTAMTSSPVNTEDSELDETLLVLPFHFVVDLLHLMKQFVEKSSEIELSQRVVGFLLRIHFSQIVANKIDVSDLRTISEQRAQHLMDITGFVLAGLRYNKQRVLN